MINLKKCKCGQSIGNIEIDCRECRNEKNRIKQLAGSTLHSIKKVKLRELLIESNNLKQNNFSN